MSTQGSQITEFVLCLGVATGFAAYFYNRRNKVAATTEHDMQVALRHVEVDDDDESPLKGSGSARYRSKRFRRVKLVSKVVRELKIKFQVIDKPEHVDRIAISRYAHDVMQSMKDISRADIMRVAPLAAELYWAKTHAEILASQVKNSNVVKLSNAKFKRRYFGSIWQQCCSWFAPADNIA